jgi:endoglucanase
VKTRHPSIRAEVGWGALTLVLAAACVPPGRTASDGEAAELLGSCGAPGLLDDGEDGNNQIKPTGGRGGYWYTYIDGSGSGSTIWPPPGAQGNAFAMSRGGVNSSRFAANVKGQVGTAEIVYAALGMNFVDPKGLYDASKYKGVSFWAKKGPEGGDRVRFRVPDISTDEAGGICRDCSNDFGADIILSDMWQRYVLTWRKLKQQPGWGTPRPHGVKPAKLFGLQWQVNQRGASFDFWVDDVEFIGCE